MLARAADAFSAARARMRRTLAERLGTVNPGPVLECRRAARSEASGCREPHRAPRSAFDSRHGFRGCGDGACRSEARTQFRDLDVRRLIAGTPRRSEEANPGCCRRAPRAGFRCGGG